MLIIPFRLGVLFPVLPIANWVLIGLCTLMFGLLYGDMLPYGLIANLVLDGWNPIGLFGHILLHGGFFHLLGNMIFLNVFGNAICSKIGSLRYLVVFVICALGAAIIHNITDGDRAIGASGAISGIVAFFLTLYPSNPITCWYFFLFRFGTFETSGRYIITLWFILDIWGAFTSEALIAYWAHIGGFLTGFGLGYLFIARGWVPFDKVDNPHLFQKWYPIETYDLATSSQQVRAVESDRQYYVSQNDVTFGPFSLQKIASNLHEGIFVQEDYIWIDEREEWVTLGEYFAR